MEEGKAHLHMQAEKKNIIESFFIYPHAFLSLDKRRLVRDFIVLQNHLKEGVGRWGFVSSPR